MPAKALCAKLCMVFAQPCYAAQDGITDVGDCLCSSSLSCYTVCYCSIAEARTDFGNMGLCLVQVVGFLILVAGTSMYNELLRGCLPGVPPPVTTEESLEVCFTAPSSLLSMNSALLLSHP